MLTRSLVLLFSSPSSSSSSSPSSSSSSSFSSTPSSSFLHPPLPPSSFFYTPHHPPPPPAPPTLPPPLLPLRPRPRRPRPRSRSRRPRCLPRPTRCHPPPCPFHLHLSFVRFTPSTPDSACMQKQSDEFAQRRRSLCCRCIPSLQTLARLKGSPCFRQATGALVLERENRSYADALKQIQLLPNVLMDTLSDDHVFTHPLCYANQDMYVLICC